MKREKEIRKKLNLKPMLVIPVIALIMIALSSCGEKVKSTESAKEEIASSQPQPQPQSETGNKVVAGQPVPAGEVPPPPPPPPFTIENGDTTWTEVDEMPIYQGGDKALLNFVKENIYYPENAKAKGIQGKVIVSFTVTEKGGVTNVTIVNKVSPEIDTEALRVVNSLPDFAKPGIKNGKSVRVHFMLPITFTLK
jgi:TonB family protein